VEIFIMAGVFSGSPPQIPGPDTCAATAIPQRIQVPVRV
jgi:hypothetical protein